MISKALTLLNCKFFPVLLKLKCSAISVSQLAVLATIWQHFCKICIFSLFNLGKQFNYAAIHDFGHDQPKTIFSIPHNFYPL